MHAIKIIMMVFLLILGDVAYADPNADVINQTIGELMKKNAIPGVAVLLYVEGKPYAYYFGYANPDKKIPVTQHTIFEMGSISKIMTSILLAQEVDFAKMGFSDPIDKYIHGLPDSFDDITLQDLATHTSGLPFNLPKTIQSRKALEGYFAKWAPEYASEEQWQYSNIGVGLLGDALVNATGKDFDKLYLRHILIPLKMQPITSNVPKRLQRFYAQGYDQAGKPVEPLGAILFPAAGGLKVSAGDMQRFLSAAIGLPDTPVRVLYPMLMTQSVFVKLPDSMQGLGWQIHSLRDNRRNLLHAPEVADLGPIAVEEVYDRPMFKDTMLIDKTGATRGFRAYIAVIPNKKAGIVILANKNISNGEIVNAGRAALLKLVNE